MFRSVGSHPEPAVAAVAASRLLREGHRRVDVLLLRVRLLLPHGVRHRQQLHGPRGHQVDEGLLGRGPHQQRRQIYGK